MIEGLILAGGGALLGLLLGHGIATLLGRLLRAGQNMGLTGLTWLPEELYRPAPRSAWGCSRRCSPRSKRTGRTSPKYWRRARDALDCPKLSDHQAGHQDEI